jgi:predicted site-specific integrase-resolvase
MNLLLSPKDVSERTGIPLGTLRFYMRTGKSPFNFKRLPSGKIVIPEEELKKGIAALSDYNRRS